MQWAVSCAVCTLHITQTNHMSALLNRQSSSFVCFSLCFRLQRHDNYLNDGMAQGSVSVNVPQFSVPPLQGVAQVSVISPSSAGAEASVSQPHEKRRTISLPDVCRESLYPVILKRRYICFHSVVYFGSSMSVWEKIIAVKTRGNNIRQVFIALSAFNFELWFSSVDSILLLFVRLLCGVVLDCRHCNVFLVQ